MLRQTGFLGTSHLANGVRIVGLNKDNVPSWWVRVKDYVEKATVKGPGALSEEELRHGCENGYYQLWLIIRDPDVIGCGITQIVDEPYRRVLEIVAIGGRELKDWLHFDGYVGDRAKKEMGASAVRVFCRPGIKHLIEPIGYRIKGYICERQL
jgi:hypothetical protein